MRYEFVYNYVYNKLVYYFRSDMVLLAHEIDFVYIRYYPVRIYTVSQKKRPNFATV